MTLDEAFELYLRARRRHRLRFFHLDFWQSVWWYTWHPEPESRCPRCGSQQGRR